MPQFQRPGFAALGSLFVGVWAVTSAVATSLNLPTARWLELQTQTMFFRLRGPVTPPHQIVVLAIDDDSLAQGANFRELKELAPIRTWPWRRIAYAQAIDQLMAAGAKAVSLDLIFDLPSDRLADDQRLQKTLQRYAGRVTLAVSQSESLATGGSLMQLALPTEGLQTSPQSIGLINYPVEANGQVHRLGTVFLEQLDPSLRQSYPNLRTFDEASLTAANLSFASPKGDYINYYGRQASFLTLPFWQVLYPRNWEVLQQQQVFKDKIVLIGSTAASLHDVHPSPFGKMPGIEIHANALATLLENRSITEAVPNPLGCGILLLLGVASIEVSLGRRFRRAVPRFFGSLGVAAIWVGIGYVSFVYAGMIVPVAMPVVAIALSGLSYLGIGAIDEQLEKLRLRRTLERYVSPAVVQEILAQPEDFRALLQGRKLNAAVLFCDIRGFTSLSYKLPAEQLIAQLNDYLNVMVQAIVETGGTVDKFIGDAVMAEFGAPVSRGVTADALSAIHAALKMRQALSELRLRWQQQGKTPLFHGIGISFGEVIAGNIGSLQRLEYTAIGDTVNVASRVESLTKNFWTDILITESLYCLVQEQVEVVFVGEHRLRGREESPTQLYSLVGLKGADRRLYQQVHEELRRYLTPEQS